MSIVCLILTRRHIYDTDFRINRRPPRNLPFWLFRTFSYPLKVCPVQYAGPSYLGISSFGGSNPYTFRSCQFFTIFIFYFFTLHFWLTMFQLKFFGIDILWLKFFIYNFCLILNYDATLVWSSIRICEQLSSSWLTLLRLPHLFVFSSDLIEHRLINKLLIRS